MTEIDYLVPDPVVRKEFGVCEQTFYRWDNNPAKAALGWPPPVRINSRKFRSRKLLEQYKALLIQRAQDDRSKRRAKSDAVLIEANEPAGAA